MLATNINTIYIDVKRTWSLKKLYELDGLFLLIPIE